MELNPGTRVKNYTLERQLGKGASGEVWRAYDETKMVAIKFMNENLMQGASAAKHRERLLREVEALRRLEHPNVPTLYDYDLDFVRPYLAMRYVGGDSYDRLISTGEMLRIPLGRRLEAIRELAFALTAAHDAGIIHRDIKPANMTGIESPFLLDFSISLPKVDAERTARFVGTTLYMAPDGVVDRLSDNYSFAVVVFEILFGRHPIYRLGDSVFNQFIAEMRIQNREWSFPSAIPAAQLPADLQTADLRKLDMIFERAIGSRERRYADLREFVRELHEAIYPAGSPPIQHYSSYGSVAPLEHVSQPPPVPPPAPQPPVIEPPVIEAEAPEEEVAEQSFLDKAFLNLPAIKPPVQESDEPPAVERTGSYDIANRSSDVEGEVEAVDYGTGTGMPAAPAPDVDDEEDEDDDRSSEFSSPDAMTMMEIPISRPPASEPVVEPEPEEVEDLGFAEPDAMTMMEIPISRPPVPEPEVEPELEPEEEDLGFAEPDAMTMMEIPVSRPPAPEPVVEPEDMGERTIPEIPVSKPPEFDDRTMPEIRVPQPQPSHYPQGESFTMMEVQTPQSSQYAQGESFTMMEMQAAQPHAAPDPFENENFTQMQMESPLQQKRVDLSGVVNGDHRRWLIIGLVVLVVVIVVVILIVALTSGIRVS